MSCQDEVVVALYEYIAMEAEELSIKKNEQLVLLDAKNNWWKVRNNSMKIGLVPSNYLKRDKKGESLINRFANKFPIANKKRSASTTSSNVSNLSNNSSMLQTNQKLLTGGQTAVPASLVTGHHPPPDHNSANNEYFVSKFSFQATKGDEMSLTKNMRVLVLQKEGDGWWLGRDASDPAAHEGWFPSNYVVREAASVQALKTQAQPAPKQPVVNAQQQREQQQDIDDDEVICVVRALYAFDSGNQEELAFEQDEMLDVVEDPLNDPEWWVCRNHLNKTGLVPKNYVEVVPNPPPTTTNNQDSAINYDPVTREPTPLNNQQPSSVILPHNNGTSSNQQQQHTDGETWFFGKLSRVEAENLLRSRAQTGEFLVRNSETSSGDLSISMRMEERIRHFKVQLHEGVYKIGQKRFDSMKALLDHYKQSPIFTNENGRAFLTLPMPR